ncbi:hypothetical protein MRX96_041189 [Rhipicephalus microplus]
MVNHSRSHHSPPTRRVIHVHIGAECGTCPCRRALLLTTLDETGNTGTGGARPKPPLPGRLGTREPALVNGPSLLHLNRHHWGGGEGGGRGQGRGKVARVARTASPPVAAEGEERSTDRSQWNAHVRRRRHLREDRQRPALVSLLRPVCVCTAHAPGPCSMGPVAATASTAFSGPARACRTRARREGALCVGEQRLHWDAGATSPARRATPGSGGLRKHHTSEPPSERLTNESRRLYE